MASLDRFSCRCLPSYVTVALVFGRSGEELGIPFTKESAMRIVVVPFAGLLTLAGLLGAQAPPDRPHSEAVLAILKLADNLDAKDVAMQAEKIVKEHDSCDISEIFRPRRFGGAGIGRLGAKPNENSIDHLVRRRAGNKPPTKEELQKHRTDLVKTTRVLQAMAELAPFRMPPRYKGNDKKIAEWNQVTAEFKVNTRDLRERIEKADATKVRETVLKLQQVCNQCHSLARD